MRQTSWKSVIEQWQGHNTMVNSYRDHCQQWHWCTDYHGSFHMMKCILNCSFCMNISSYCSRLRSCSLLVSAYFLAPRALMLTQVHIVRLLKSTNHTVLDPLTCFSKPANLGVAGMPSMHAVLPPQLLGGSLQGQAHQPYIGC